MIMPTQLSPYMTVPRHVCDQTHLSPDRFDLWPDTLVPRHISAQTQIIVARHDPLLG